jgi:hypothetical protein
MSFSGDVPKCVYFFMPVNNFGFFYDVGGK